jgi:glycosyltransferase involved in cell wall biosynthesis
MDEKSLLRRIALVERLHKEGKFQECLDLIGRLRMEHGEDVMQRFPLPASLASETGSDAIRIVYYNMGAPVTACQVLRVMSPLKLLERRGLVRFETLEITTDARDALRYRRAAEKADILLLQRACTLDFVRVIAGSTLAGKTIVYEIDDDLFSLPAEHVLYDKFGSGRDKVLELVKAADAVTVTTDHLKERMSRYNPNVCVLPNCIDPEIWPETAPVSDDNRRITIGYAGSFTHEQDLAFMRPLAERLQRRYGEKIAFAFLGCAPQAFIGMQGVTYDKGGYAYREYASVLSGCDWTIAIAPLRDDVFNRSKSNIKYLEYSRCRMAGVYADSKPYADSVRDGETGLLAAADNVDDWYDKICRLIEDSALRRRIAQDAFNDVSKNYMLDLHAERWMDVFREACGRKKRPEK